MAETLNQAALSDSSLDGVRDGGTGGAATDVGDPSSKKTRHRILRGMQRISSSSSLSRLSGSRPASHPYDRQRGFSCVCIPSGVVSFRSQAASISALSSSSSSSSPDGTSLPPTPASEMPTSDEADDPRGPRKVLTTAVAGATRSLSALPPPPLPSNLGAGSQRGAVDRSTLQASAATASGAAAAVSAADWWRKLPPEIWLHVLSFLGPLDLVRVAPVSRSMYQTCFDGQLWKSLDLSSFHHTLLPDDARSLFGIAAGPFARNLNLRGCVQLTGVPWADLMIEKCDKLHAATLEGCRRLTHSSVTHLAILNPGLRSIDLCGLQMITNATCKAIASWCPQLEMINVSHCSQVKASGLASLVTNCRRLRDLRAAKVRGFDDLTFAKATFAANRLQRLVLAGCSSLTDAAFRIMMYGTNPELDILTDIPMVPVRRLRHLDLGRCSRLTGDAIRTMAHLVPDLEGLVVSGCSEVGDDSLRDVLMSTPRLAFLEMADLPRLTDELLTHLAQAPCAPRLRHLSVSSCASINDAGVLPILAACVSLESLVLDNTLVGDRVLFKAADVVHKRTAGVSADARPGRSRKALHMVVYDCRNITTTSIRWVLAKNADHEAARQRSAGQRGAAQGIISLECCHQHQQAVDEFMRRLARGDVAGARRLDKLWAAHLAAEREVAQNGGSLFGRFGRRRRRVRNPAGLRPEAGPRPARAREGYASCVVM
jgi:F-box/leucine-rich repeat protein 2/20